MDAHFVDRLLICSDCQGEFIFTAGEQLFFNDKQFKNDPKRCKPCKSRRSGLAAVANGVGVQAAGLSRTETRTQCSACGIDTTVPFRPTQGRPVLCRQCFQTKNRITATLPSTQHSPQEGYSSARSAAETASALTTASNRSGGQSLSPAAALLAAVSMAAASPSSCISSAADLASISAPSVRQHSSVSPVPAYAEPVSVEVTAVRTAVLLGK